MNIISHWVYFYQKLYYSFDHCCPIDFKIIGLCVKIKITLLAIVTQETIMAVWTEYVIVNVHFHIKRKKWSYSIPVNLLICNTIVIDPLHIFNILKMCKFNNYTRSPPAHVHPTRARRRRGACAGREKKV